MTPRTHTRSGDKLERGRRGPSSTSGSGSGSASDADATNSGPTERGRGAGGGGAKPATDESKPKWRGGGPKGEDEAKRPRR
jgi:hypothetical protein